MAKSSEIEKYGCQEIVSAGVREGKSPRAIAAECSEWAGEDISHTAVATFPKLREQHEKEAKRELIIGDKRRLLKTVKQEIDIIQTNLDATKHLIEWFEMVDDGQGCMPN